MIVKDLGIVIKRTNFRETSVLVDIFTKNHGKISGILKGFYRGKKEFTSSLDIFTLNEILFYPSRRLSLISAVDLVKDFSYLSKDYKKAFIAAKFIKAIDKLLPYGERNEEIFSLIYLSLSALKENSFQKIFYIFFIKFLNFSGLRPNLANCIKCERPVDKLLFFDASGGGIVCKYCSKFYNNIEVINPKTAAFIDYIQREKFIFALRVAPDEDTEKEILHLLNIFFQYHLDFSLI